MLRLALRAPVTTRQLGATTREVLWRRAYHGGRSDPYLDLPWFARRRVLLLALGTSAIGGLTLLSSPSLISLDAQPTAKSNPETSSSDSLRSAPPPPNESLLALLRAYAVYTLCSIPLFVDNGPQILSTLDSIPVVRTIASAMIRYTFFDHVRLPRASLSFSRLLC